jgi:hypothetical protein
LKDVSSIGVTPTSGKRGLATTGVDILRGSAGATGAAGASAGKGSAVAEPCSTGPTGNGKWTIGGVTNLTNTSIQSQ